MGKPTLRPHLPESGPEERPPDGELLDLFQFSLEMLCIAGTDGYFKRVNPAFERILGHTTEELLARPFIEFVHPDDRARTQDVVDKLIAGVPTVLFENRYRCRDGSYRWLSWTAAPQAGGQRIYAAASDVTQRKRIEEQFHALVESAPDAMIVVDRQGLIVLVNAQAETTFGYAREELLGQSVEILVPSGFRRQHVAERAAYAAAPHTRTMGKHPALSGQRKDGTVFPVEIALSPIETEQGVLVHAAVRDVTERKRAEQLIRENEVQMLAAQRIQARLLPVSPPSLPGFDIAGAAYPADFAGGDTFDYLTLSDGSLGLAIGDVTGHGVSRALLMASSQAYLHALTHTSSDLNAIMNRANEFLIEETEDDHFVTLLLGRLEPHARSFTYSSAGHPSAYVLDASGEVKQRLDSTGMPLGIAPDADFPLGAPALLEPGDLLLLVTDGIMEAMSPDDVFFGEERMLESVRAHCRQTSREIVEGLYQDVLHFAQRATPADDVTLVVVKVAGQ